MEEKEFKELVEEMKSFFGVSSIEKVAEKLGKSRVTGTTWRGRKAIPSDVLLDYYELKSQAGLEPSYQSFKSKTPKITYYPNIKASAGYGIINENEESIEIDTNLLSAIKMPHKKLDMIQVQGDSMHPYIQNGDFALIERSSEAKNGDIVIANYQGDLYVKQIQKNPQNKSISFISSNKEYPSFEVKGTDLESLVIVGILRGVIRAY
ncbi:LexA family transcriptional regulator [Helicobacter typhlonius]|uniref:S24 family peptidase n=1 Tax=Helicobacter typhlonius TaxID=76936 RepID=UPI00261AF254|nr:LexA family transcriptional regulator [uncultured Helicobacter sp.]